MQGIFFSLAATATLLHLVGSKVPGTLKNAVWVMFEVFTAVSILICVVVWTVLIPAFEASGNTLALKLMYSWFGLTAHNANGKEKGDSCRFPGVVPAGEASRQIQHDL